MHGTRHRRIGWTSALALLAATALGGCTASPWNATYVGRRDPGAALEAERGAARPVVVRSVPWERIEQTLRELDAEIAATDVHPDEWPEARKEAAKARLLRGLQVSDPAELIEVLGKSEFRTTDRVHPETPKGEAELVAFARLVGADLVVWSGRYLGKADRVVKEPVTTYSSGTDWGWTRDDARRPLAFSESSTTWVPVRVQMDELGYVAYFLRRK